MSYWRDEASIAQWKAQSEHLIAQGMGIKAWYQSYHLHIARVERAYAGPEGRG